MMKAAITKPVSGAVTAVQVTTKGGDTYSFPGMDTAELRAVLPEGKREPPATSQPALTMVNASYAVLSIPFRIIKTIAVDGEVWWDSPA